MMLKLKLVFLKGPMPPEDVILDKIYSDCDNNCFPLLFKTVIVLDFAFGENHKPGTSKEGNQRKLLNFLIYRSPWEFRR